MLSLLDFNQRYVGTYIQYLPPMEKVPITVFVRRLDALNQVQGDLQLGIDSKLIVERYPQVWDRLLLQQPTTGYFNYNKTAQYLFRYPERQWRRGLCHDNAEIVNPLRRVITTIRFYQPNFTSNSVDAIFKKYFEQDLESIYKKLTSKNEIMSIAFNSNLMWSRSMVDKYDLILWYQLHPVGYVLANETVCRISNPQFSQEIYDEVHMPHNEELRKFQWEF